MYRKRDLGSSLISSRARATSTERVIQGWFQNLPGFLFNPARFFSLYFDRVALLHSKSDTPSDLLFPSCRYFSKVEHSLDKPVSYMSCLSNSNFLLMKQKIDVGLSRVVTLHEKRGGHPCCQSLGTPPHCPEVHACQVWGNGWVLRDSQRRRFGKGYQVSILIILFKFLSFSFILTKEKEK